MKMEMAGEQQQQNKNTEWKAMRIEKFSSNVNAFNSKAHSSNMLQNYFKMGETHNLGKLF